METKIEFKVHESETVFFIIKLLISAILYYFIIDFLIEEFSSYDPQKNAQYILILYVVLIFVYLFGRFGLLIGYIKGNAIKIGENQFPNIYNIVVTQSNMLGLKSIPTVYIMQSGGVLNAFAARFMGNNYVVLYSEIVEIAYEKDINLLKFIIGHELGHIKRNHMVKRLLLFPSLVVPFLGPAYSRGCEYTCDNIGFNLAPDGLKSGLLVLASGRSIYKKVNLEEYLKQDYGDDSFWKWFAELVSSHPNFTKRIAALENETTLEGKGPATISIEEN